jgi:putative membrane protein
MVAVLTLALLLVANPAAAHDGQPHSGVFIHWTFDPWILVPLVVSAALYGIGIARLWRRAGRGRGVRPWQAHCYAAGWCVLALALVAPIHYWGERLFFMHMIEHELLMAVAAPLLAVARPAGAFMWALPRALRCAVAAAVHAPRVRATWRWLSRPITATVLHGVAIWAWHVPALFDAALVHPGMHRLQHLSFFGTGLLFWWVMLARSRQSYGAASLHLFATMTHMGLLGALISVAPKLIYQTRNPEAVAWGLTPLEDQQLGGLLMWVPVGLVYAAAALALCALWISPTTGRSRHAGAPS